MTAGGYDPNQYPQGDPNQYPGQPQFNQGPGPQPGDLGTRLGARIIDGILVTIVTVILYFITGSNFIIYGILAGVIGIGYFVAFEVTQGWTPGKKILGLSVRGPGGAAKPDPKSSVIRNSFYLLAIIPFVGGLLELAAIIYIAVTINSSPTKQGKHDELAGGTQVVKG
jgi:uncharacterized RDD family membrane protein YckC